MKHIRLKKIYNRLLNLYFKLFGDEVTLNERIFWSVVPITLLAALITMTITFYYTGISISSLTTALCVLVTIAMMVVGYKTEKYDLCYFIFLLVFNCITIPAAFMTNGGLLSCTPIICICCILLSSICVDRRFRLISFACTYVVNSAMMIFSHYHPEYVLQYSNEFAEKDIINGYLILSIIILLLCSVVFAEIGTQRYRELNDGIIDVLGTAVEFKSEETGNHIRNIKGFVKILLLHALDMYDDLDFTKTDVPMICSASALHDVGKIAVPDYILSKPGKFTEKEYEEMKMHTVKGCEIIRSMKDIQNETYFNYCYEICRHHHERYDGKGYPDGLSKDEISFVSQIVSVADVYDALISKRAYKGGFSFDSAYDTIMEGCGTVFSPRAIACFAAARDDIESFAKESHHVN